MHDRTLVKMEVIRRRPASVLATLVLVGTLSACMSPFPRGSDAPSGSASSIVDATAVEKQLTGVKGLASSQVSFQTTGFVRRAIVNLYVTTDDPSRLSAIQDYSTRCLFTNTILPRPAEILEIFSWSPTLGPGADNQSPRAAIVAAIGDKAGVSIRSMGPNASLYAIIDTSKFDGGLKSTVPPTPPAWIVTAPPPITSPPTTAP
jgi:hypothetical protein